MMSEGFNREKYGMYYDVSNECMYLIGGHGAPYSVERYDIYKDLWCHTSTVFEHTEYPIAWMDGFVLYIAGNKENSIGTVECLDTRMNESHCILANKELQIDKILPPCSFKRLFCNNVC